MFAVDGNRMPRMENFRSRAEMCSTVMIWQTAHPFWPPFDITDNITGHPKIGEKKRERKKKKMTFQRIFLTSYGCKEQQSDLPKGKQQQQPQLQFVMDYNYKSLYTNSFPSPLMSLYTN